jgi:hypothetical protein
VGDVVNPVSFKKRMREYAEQGIEHFYFMMLQKDEVRPNYAFFFLFLTLLISLSMRRKVEGWDVSQTTAAIQIAMSPSGPSETTCGWEFLRSEISRHMKS